MASLRGAFRFVGGILVAASLASLISAASEHDEARARWKREAGLLLTENYDEVASDRAYRQTRAAHRRAGASALALALGVWWVLATTPPRSRRIRSASAPRRVAASWVDLVLALAIGALWTVDDAESAWLHALSIASPILALGTHAVPLQLGATAGMALLRLRSTDVGAGRAALASLLLPACLLGVVRASWAGLSWRLAGVALGRDAQ